MDGNIQQNTKTLLVLVGAVVVALGIALFFLRAPQSEPAPLSDTAVTALIEDTSVSVTPAVPSADPLASVTDAVNPLEKTNPFENDYENPFE